MHQVAPARELLLLRRSYPNGFFHPAYWYDYGVPLDRQHTYLWQLLTPLKYTRLTLYGNEAGNWPADGEIQAWWDTIAAGPILVTSPSRGQGHARIARGVKRQAHQHVRFASVILQDPQDRDPVPHEMALATLIFEANLALSCPDTPPP